MGERARRCEPVRPTLYVPRQPWLSVPVLKLSSLAVLLCGGSASFVHVIVSHVDRDRAHGIDLPLRANFRGPSRNPDELVLTLGQARQVTRCIENAIARLPI